MFTAYLVCLSNHIVVCRVKCGAQTSSLWRIQILIINNISNLCDLLSFKMHRLVLLWRIRTQTNKNITNHYIPLHTKNITSLVSSIAYKNLSRFSCKYLIWSYWQGDFMAQLKECQTKTLGPMVWGSIPGASVFKFLFFGKIIYLHSSLYTPGFPSGYMFSVGS